MCLQVTTPLRNRKAAASSIQAYIRGRQTRKQVGPKLSAAAEKRRAAEAERNWERQERARFAQEAVQHSRVSAQASSFRHCNVVVARWCSLDKEHGLKSVK